MSTTYQPANLPDDQKQFQAAVAKEFNAIKRGAEDAAPSLQLVVLHAAPARVLPGMLVYASGAPGWNPGSGEGVYRRSKDNTAWVFLG